MVFALIGLAGLVPVHAAAQSETEEHASDGQLLLTNALIGSVTAGVARMVRDGSWDGFWAGALGGAVAFGGRRVAAMGFDGAGLVGRQVSALGASVTRNAIEARPLLAELVFPVGPVRFYASRDRGAWAVRPRVDLLATGILVTAVLRNDRSVDWSASASSGAVVVDLEGSGEEVAGLALGGTIFIRPHPTADRAAVLAHERVHVLQKDFAFHVLGDPVEDRLMRADPSLAWLNRYVDLNVFYPLTEKGFYSFFGVRYEDRPHEREAEALEARSR